MYHDGKHANLPAAQDFFFFQAEDGIRDRNVTGVQTCALPISCAWNKFFVAAAKNLFHAHVGWLFVSEGRAERSEERRVGKEWREHGEGWELETREERVEERT